MDVKYFAGFFDGEGCIIIGRNMPESIGRKSMRHYLVLTVTNTNQDILQTLKKHFGGTVRDGTAKSAINRVWIWTANSSQAAKILKLLYPYLRVKRKEAEYGLEFYELTRVDNGRHSFIPLLDETVALRDAYYWKLRELKQEAKVQR